MDCRRLATLAFVCLAVWAREAMAAGAPAPLPVREIAAGVFVHSGVHEESTVTNRGDLANIGFVVGRRCVAVIDTGGSASVGRGLRAAIRAVTPLPVCYVINTHVHPDHIFGNAAFRDDAPVYVGHARLPAAMAARGTNYLRALQRELGDAAAGSEVVPPTQRVADRAELDLGGRILELRAWKTAHTDNDLTVFDRETGTLWLSDLLFLERIPVVDGSLRGWLAAIDELARLPARHVVPGHGRADAPWPQALAAQRTYLAVLAADIRRAIAAGRTIGDAVETAAASESDKWLLFDAFNRRNAAAAFAELEWE